MSIDLICCLDNGLYCSGIIVASRAAYRVMVAIVFDMKDPINGNMIEHTTIPTSRRINLFAREPVMTIEICLTY